VCVDDATRRRRWLLLRRLLLVTETLTSARPPAHSLAARVMFTAVISARTQLRRRR